MATKQYLLPSKEIFIKDGSIQIDNSPITPELNYGDKIEVNKK